MGTSLAMRFEEALDDLVAEYIQRGLDLGNIAASLELKCATVGEAADQAAAEDADRVEY